MLDSCRKRPLNIEVYKLFMLFVDLRKAYDSIPSCALWKILRQYGVPKVMVNLLRSLHDGTDGLHHN